MVIFEVVIAIVTGDIIHSRRLSSQQAWIHPLKELFKELGKSPATWDIFRGDSFQLEVSSPEEALMFSFRIKATVKSISSGSSNERHSPVDVRMAIGIGEKDHLSGKISENSGSAFIRAGERFDSLKKDKITLAIASPWSDFDREMNLYLELAAVFMDNWSIASGELVNTHLLHPHKTQSEIGVLLGIAQNSVSKRYNTAHIDELIKVDHMYRHKLKHKHP